MDEDREELELIQGCAKGDPQSLEVLVKENLRMVLSIAYRFTRDAAEAEDLCQEILVKAVRNLDRFRGGSRIKTWIYSIAVSHCINYRRSRTVLLSPGCRTLEGLDRASEGKGPDQQLLEQETAVAVHEAVNGLPERLQSVVLLHEFEGLTHPEVARRLGIPEGTVWSRLNKARAVLRRKLLRYA
jgi:RNA polymerase sigma-70 factor (ECF subfamily)